MDNLTLEFYYKNQFDSETTTRTIVSADTLETEEEIEYVVDQFKRFLIVCTFSTSVVERIVLKDENEQES